MGDRLLMTGGRTVAWYWLMGTRAILQEIGCWVLWEDGQGCFWGNYSTYILIYKYPDGLIKCEVWGNSWLERADQIDEAGTLFGGVLGWYGSEEQLVYAGIEDLGQAAGYRGFVAPDHEVVDQII